MVTPKVMRPVESAANAKPASGFHESGKLKAVAALPPPVAERVLEQAEELGWDTEDVIHIVALLNGVTGGE